MNWRTIVLGSVLVWITAAVAQAQYWGPYYHSSTYAEGVQRGAADIIRSAGQYNVRNSEAAKNWTEVQSRLYENRVKAAQSFVEMKNIQEAYRQSRRKPRPTSEQLIRMAKMEVPKPLSASELDPVTGKISWPLELTADEYAPVRSRLETLFAERAAVNGKINLNQYKAIINDLEEMKTLLVDRLKRKEVLPEDYTKAIKFIKQLRQQLRYNQ
ncbi:MAG TPA: hypothetical protein ENJ16_03640 [Planctomycetaceae bacterium]|nr:hypothetical protein [Planctomycetaceae bacterium]